MIKKSLTIGNVRPCVRSTLAALRPSTAPAGHGGDGYHVFDGDGGYAASREQAMADFKARWIK